MSNYQRPRGSVDVRIEEIPEGTHRVKIVGSIVNLSPTTVTVNDGTGTVIFNLGSASIEGMELKKFGRFLADISRAGEKLLGELIVWKEIPRDLVKKYRKLVSVERRIPKS